MELLFKCTHCKDDCKYQEEIEYCKKEYRTFETHFYEKEFYLCKNKFKQKKYLQELLK